MHHCALLLSLCQSPVVLTASGFPSVHVLQDRGSPFVNSASCLLQLLSYPDNGWRSFAYLFFTAFCIWLLESTSCSCRNSHQPIWQGLCCKVWFFFLSSVLLNYFVGLCGIIWAYLILSLPLRHHLLEPALACSHGGLKLWSASELFLLPRVKTGIRDCLNS